MRNISMVINPEDLPTRKDILEQYRNTRCLKIEMHPNYPDKVISISYKKPCLLCNTYHRLGSKASAKCIAKLVGIAYCIVNEEEK